MASQSLERTGHFAPPLDDAGSPGRFSPSRREWLSVCLLMLAALILWIPYYARSRPVAIQYPDSMDYAQIARNVHNGHGLTTDTMPLAGFAWRAQTGRLDAPWWNVHRFPLPSWIEAGLFRVFGVNDLAVTLFSALFFFATIPLVYLFARRLFSARVALAATFLFTFSAGVIELSITGATEPAATFFFLATLYLVLWPRGLWSFVLAGVLTGLAYLNRSSIVLYAVPLLWLIAREHREYRWKALAAFVLPAFAIVVPWLVRNIRVAGDPMFSLTTAIMARMSTPASPSADDWYQFAYVKPVSFWLSHPAWIIKKWIREAFGLWQNIADVGGLGMVFPLFVLSVLKEQTGTAERLRRWLFWIFVLHVAVLGLLSNLPRYYTIFAPFMAMYAADVMLWGWESTKARVRPVAALVFMVLAAPLMFRWLDRLIEPVSADNPEMSSREISKDNLRWLAANTPKGATLVSDIPWTVAWYADRRCAPLPPTPDQMSAFVKYHSRPDGIYLRRPDVRPGVPDGWSRWKTVFDAHAPIPGYRVARVFANRAVYYERYGRVSIGNPPAAMVPTATPRR